MQKEAIETIKGWRHVGKREFAELMGPVVAERREIAYMLARRSAGLPESKGPWATPQEAKMLVDRKIEAIRSVLDEHDQALFERCKEAVRASIAGDVPLERVLTVHPMTGLRAIATDEAGVVKGFCCGCNAVGNAIEAMQETVLAHVLGARFIVAYNARPGADYIVFEQVPVVWDTTLQ